MRLTVKQRIWGGFIIITSLLLIISGNLLLKISQIDDAAHQVTDIAVPALDHSAILELEFALMSKVALSSYYSADQGALNTLTHQYQKEKTQFLALILELETLVKDQPELSQLALKIHHTYDTFDKSATALFAQKAQSFALTSSLNQQLNQLSELSDSIHSLSLDLIDLSDLNGLENDAPSAYRTLKKLPPLIKGFKKSSSDILIVNDEQALSQREQDQDYYLVEIEKVIAELALHLNHNDLYAELSEQFNTLNTITQGDNTLAAQKYNLFNAQRYTKRSLSEAETKFDLALKDLSNLVAKVKRLTQHAENELKTEVDSANLWTWLGMIFAVIAANLITFFIIKSIITPLNHTNKVLNLVAAGDMTQQLNEQSNDEFAELAKSVNTLINNMRDVIQGIMSRSDQLSAAAEQTSIITKESEQAIDSQLQKIEQTASATTQMNCSAELVSNHAKQVLGEIKQADVQAANVKTIATENKNTIASLALEVSQAEQVINQLHQDSSAIGSILEVIRGIAEQTNLLALNAAIEAARAGEHGRGFAVVADEVRSLASKTQGSTEEIDTMIATLQQGAQAAVAVMSKGKQQAQNCVTQVDQAAHALESLTQSVTTTFNESEQITTATNEQCHVTNEINEHLESIVAISRQTLAGAHQTSDASLQVATLTEELRQSVAQFKVQQSVA